MITQLAQDGLSQQSDEKSKNIEPHPRQVVMELAAKELLVFVHPWAARHCLTAIEYLFLMAVPTHQQIETLCFREREIQDQKRAES